MAVLLKLGSEVAVYCCVYVTKSFFIAFALYVTLVMAYVIVDVVATSVV